MLTAKQNGFSLVEMLISMTLANLILVSAVSVYPQWQITLTRYYQQFRLEQIINQALFDISKDTKRAGFKSNPLVPKTLQAISINSAANCIIIRYDSKAQGDLVNGQNAIFAYRFGHENIEYKMGSDNCESSHWEKLFDPAEIRIESVNIQQNKHVITISLTASWRNNRTIYYSTKKFIRNENHV